MAPEVIEFKKRFNNFYSERVVATQVVAAPIVPVVEDPPLPKKEEAKVISIVQEIIPEVDQVAELKAQLAERDATIAKLTRLVKRSDVEDNSADLLALLIQDNDNEITSGILGVIKALYATNALNISPELNAILRDPSNINSDLAGVLNRFMTAK